MQSRDGGGGSEYEPKGPPPFSLVSLPRAHINRRRPAGHEAQKKGTISGALQGRIVALTPVHVGAGQIELAKNIDRRLARETPLIKTHVKSGGTRVIPGSSLKGAVRSIVEAISPSCLSKTRAQRQKVRGDLRECRRTQKEQELCVACRLFGAMGYLGQISFSDGLQLSGGMQVVYAPVLHTPRSRAGSYYDSQGWILGRKFYFHGRPAEGETPLEACPEGSEFSLDVHFANLEEKELGLLLIALGQGEPKLWPKLGGFKPRCFGSVDIKVERLEIRRGGADWLAYETEVEVGDVSSYIKAAEDDHSLVLQEQARELARILRYPGDVSCPRGDY